MSWIWNFFRKQVAKSLCTLINENSQLYPDRQLSGGRLSPQQPEECEDLQGCTITGWTTWSKAPIMLQHLCSSFCHSHRFFSQGMPYFPCPISLPTSIINWNNWYIFFLLGMMCPKYSNFLLLTAITIFHSLNFGGGRYVLYSWVTS